MRQAVLIAIPSNPCVASASECLHRADSTFPKKRHIVAAATKIGRPHPMPMTSVWHLCARSETTAEDAEALKGPFRHAYETTVTPPQRRRRCAWLPFKFGASFASEPTSRPPSLEFDYFPSLGGQGSFPNESRARIRPFRP